ncbi:MAG: crotonase/enoyl-CoA hydratase family protein [Halieaceae bacterium]|jgi:enoyl-CoA hydratase|nr:crotonase/enoyl-CoA hydratase family protein [Halieaceae bacterium]
MATLVTTTQENDYTLITMDDGKANALGFDMLAQLGAALDAAEQAGKPVVIAGRHGKFSAGFDLSVMGQGGEAMLDLLRAGARLSLRLLEFPTPVVLAVSGHALAMGALLLLSADYRVGVHGTYKIGLNEVAIGMTLPYFGIELARERLARTHLGPAVALAKVYDAAGALEAGYLDEAVSEEDLLPRAKYMAEQFAALNMDAHRQTKARTREGLSAALAAAIEKELGAG